MTSAHASNRLLPSGEIYWFNFEGREIGLELTHLDPVRAKDLLDNYNNRNRHMSKNHVMRYARDMAEGLWPFTGETIIIGEDGNVQDGQNRCQAIVDSGRSVPVLIVWNISKDAMAVIDQGKGRTVRDILRTSGSTAGQDISYATTVNSAARLLMLGDQQLFKHADNHQRVALYVQKHLDVLVDASTWAKLTSADAPAIENRKYMALQRDRKSMAPSTLAALSLVMEARGGDPREIRLFFEKVIGRIRADNDDEHQSVTAVRYFFTHNTPLQSNKVSMPELMHLFHTVIVAYNKIQRRKVVALVKYSQSEPPRWFADLPKVDGHCTREGVI